MRPPWHRLERRYPHLLRAVRAALAAAVAWLLVMPIGGAADKYPYYAPLGAVIAVATTVAGSVRESVQGVTAVFIGAALALAVQPFADIGWAAEALGLAIVVGIGSLVSSWQRLGRLSGWVPIAALFVLLPGSADTEQFVVGYLGLTTLGAIVGIAANVAFAPLPLSRSGMQVRRLRDALAEQLADLAEALRGDDAPTPDEWDARLHALTPLTHRMTELVGEASDARRGNWRAGHWREAADHQYELARALEQLALLVEDVSSLLTTQEVVGPEHVALGSRLRPPAADLLAAMSELLAGLDSPVAATDPLRRVDAAMNTLVEGIRQTRGDTGDDLFAAGALVIAVRRAVTALVPDDLSDEMPSRH